MIQVIIPTCRRPRFLRIALESVRTQTAVAKISLVLVSENGGSEESRDVCDSFDDLPIRYLYRSPSLTTLDHALSWATTNDQPYTALLHDDDWWHPAHLEMALRGLQAFPECRASFSNYFCVADGILPGSTPGNLRVWVASGCDFTDTPMVHLGFPNALVANLLLASFHYSTLVARTDSFAVAISDSLATGNDLDNDRMVPMCLADPAGLVYSTVALVAVRNHPQQDQRNTRFDTSRWRIMAETTQWLLRKWPKECGEAAAIFNAQAARLHPEILRELRNLPEPFLSTLIKAVGLHTLSTTFAERCLVLAKMWTPPALRPALGYFRQAVSRARPPVQP